MYPAAEDINIINKKIQSSLLKLPVDLILKLWPCKTNKDLRFDKERVEELNEEKLLYRYTTLGKAGLMGEKLKSGKFEMKFNTIKIDDGDECLIVWTCDFETCSESPPSDVKIQELRAEVVAMVKMVESYLLSNPEMYN